MAYRLVRGRASRKDLSNPLPQLEIVAWMPAFDIREQPRTKITTQIT
jgi:hypothetical protein